MLSILNNVLEVILYNVFLNKHNVHHFNKGQLGTIINKYNNLIGPKNIGIIDSGILNEPYLKSKFKYLKYNDYAYSFHATAVASMISMFSCINCSLYSYNAFNKNNANYKNVISLIYIAINDGMNVINVSMSMIINMHNKESKKIVSEWNKVINYAKSKKVIIVTSAGNNGFNLDNIYPYFILPAMLDSVITVGSTLKNKQLSKYSNFGSYVSDYMPGGSLKDPLIVYGGYNFKYDPFFTKGLPKGYFKYFGTSLSAGLFTGLISSEN